MRGATIGTGARGEDAAQLYLIFLVMLGGAVVLWRGLNGLFLHFARVNRGHFARRLANRIIIGAGVLLPTVVVAALAGTVLGKIGRDHDADLWNVSLYWHFLVLTVLVTAAVIGLAPRLL